jgi:ATP-dependent Zn protease
MADPITTPSCNPGARDDLEKVTKMAYSMVCEYGMSPVIGNISMPIKGKGQGSKVIYSDKLSKEIDMVGCVWVVTVSSHTQRGC